MTPENIDSRKLIPAKCFKVGESRKLVPAKFFKNWWKVNIGVCVWCSVFWIGCSRENRQFCRFLSKKSINLYWKCSQNHKLRSWEKILLKEKPNLLPPKIKLVPAKSLAKLNLRKLIPGKSLLKPNSRKLIPTKCPKKKFAKINSKLSSLKVFIDSL